MQQMDLLQDDTKKLFFKYLLPSISATLVTSIYVLADTIMIGKGVGASGIAALNLILPVFTLFFGTGLLLGVGGSVLMSVANGTGNKKLANTYFTNAVIVGALIAVIYLILGRTLLTPIGYKLGCSDNNIALFTTYGKYLVTFCPVFVFASLLQAFVRSDNAPQKSMIAVVTGGVINIIVDYIFIFKMGMGMAGGAIATVMGSTATMLILLTHFFSKQNTMKILKGSVNIKIINKIIHSGLPSFLVEMASGIVVMLFNLQILKYVGESGVVVYSIIANTSIVAMSLFNGVSQGAQPIMAMNYGANQTKRVSEVRRTGAITAVMIGVAIFLLGFSFPEIAVNIFIKPTPEIMGMAKSAIRIYFVAFLMMSLNIFYSAYFQSILKPKMSLIICILRGLIICIALVYILPVFMGITGIWLVMPITEMATLIVAIWLVKHKGKNESKSKIN
ncbi:MAG: MATE family efflux transporter [Cellulosilyticaceae bacterium]